MSLLTDQTDVFIVRIWREPRAAAEAPLAWRGVIEHVPTGERRYFASLEQAMVFIVNFMEQIKSH